MLPFQFKIHRFREIDSTSTHARQQASLGAEEGLVYVADHQTGGRGQFNRPWVSSPGKNLQFSLLLRPPVPPSQAPILTQIACRAVAEVLRKKYGMKCAVKKPNDVMVQNKKICGILVESSSNSPKKLEDAIIGVGLNVNETPKEVQAQAISMKDVLGKDQDLHKILNQILEQFEKDLSALYAHPA
jgi:BirA family biotin operon repressor/biotin-[acetyl-CoA-carboxylase] ligase